MRVFHVYTQRGVVVFGHALCVASARFARILHSSVVESEKRSPERRVQADFYGRQNGRLRRDARMNDWKSSLLCGKQPTP